MQPLDDQLALLRHIVLVDRRTVRRANARRVRRVLVQHRQTVQRPDLFASCQRLVSRLRTFQRLLRQKRHHRVDSRIDPLDLRNMRRRHLHTGESPTADARGQFPPVSKAKISRHLQARLQVGIHL